MPKLGLLLSVLPEPADVSSAEVGQSCVYTTAALYRGEQQLAPIRARIRRRAAGYTSRRQRGSAAHTQHAIGCHEPLSYV